MAGLATFAQAIVLEEEFQDDGRSSHVPSKNAISRLRARSLAGSVSTGDWGIEFPIAVRGDGKATGLGGYTARGRSGAVCAFCVFLRDGVRS